MRTFWKKFDAEPVRAGAVATDEERLNTVGVLLTPRHDGLRDWDTSMAAISGPIELSDEDLALYRKTWGLSDVAAADARERGVVNGAEPF